MQFSHDTKQGPVCQARLWTTHDTLTIRFPFETLGVCALHPVAESSPGQSSVDQSEEDARLKVVVGRKIDAFRDAKEELGTVMYFI